MPPSASVLWHHASTSFLWPSEVWLQSVLHAGLKAQVNETTEEEGVPTTHLQPVTLYK